MSASREKKKRQEFLASGGVDPKAARAAEQKAADKKAKTLYISLAVIFVAITVFMLVFNSGILQRGKTAVTIDGTDYSVVETSFYYNTSYQNLLQNMGGDANAAYFGLDTSKPLKDQTANTAMLGLDTEISWDKYFKDQAVNSMKFIHATLAKAEAEGLTLDEAELSALDTNIQAIKDQAAANGYSYKAYLSAVFGAGMTPAIYEQLVKDNLLANKYATNYTDSLTFSDDEVKAYYEENKKNYDLVDGGYIIVDGAPETKTEEDGDEVAPTHDEIAASMAAAEEVAEDILAAYKKGNTDLKALAEEFSAYSHYSSEEITFIAGITGDWFFDEARKDGDTAILEDINENRYYVAVFNSRKQDTALDYNVRHILLDDSSVEAEGDAEVTDEMVAAKAQEILDSWDGTEEGFAALAEEFSTDDGSKSNGGLYENVNKGEMVTAFNNWCYEDGRKSGDTGIVASSYGQHIMYFVGYGTTEHWYDSCRNVLASEATTVWQDELLESTTAEIQSGMDSVGR